MKLNSLPLHSALWLCIALLTSGSLSARAQSDDPVVTDPILVSPITPPDGASQLTGSLSELRISKPDDAKYTLFQTKLTLNNAGPTVARNITATLFVSSSPYLDASSSKIKEVVLPAGKIGKNKSVTLLVKHRVNTVIASYFEGKYLVVSFRAANLPLSFGRSVAGPVATEQIKLF